MRRACRRTPAGASLAVLPVLLTMLAIAAPLGAEPDGGGEDETLERHTETFATFEARDLDGRRFTAAGLRGRVVVLDFWASWCAPCLADLPWLRRIHAELLPERVQVIGVSLDTSDRRTLNAWLNLQRVDWPQVWDRRGYEGTLARRFGVDTLPRSFLVDHEGRVVAVDLRGERLLSAISALLAERVDTATPALGVAVGPDAAAAPAHPAATAADDSVN